MGNTIECSIEIKDLLSCSNIYLGHSEFEVGCLKQINSFNKCCINWRNTVGSKISLKGKSTGDPSPKCKALTCIIQKCLTKNNFNHSKCQAHLDIAKRCNEYFFGSEYSV